MFHEQERLAKWKENLLNSLKQTAYWNTFNTKGYIGLAELVKEVPELNLSPVQQLLQNPGKPVEVSPGKELSDSLQQLYLEGLCAQQQKGIRPIAFGFPFFCMEDPLDPNKPIAAPLFLWPVELKPLTGQANTWQLTRPMGLQVLPNKVLVHYLEHKFNIPILETLEPYCRQDIPDLEALWTNLFELCSKLNMKLDYNHRELLECPDNEELKGLVVEHGAMLPCGVIAAFSPSKIAMVELAERLMAQAQDAPVEQKGDFNTHAFAPLIPDPSQENVLEAMQESAALLVRANPGSNSLSTITALLGNALSAGASCLVVAPGLSTLNRIQRRLREAELSEFSFLLEDPIHDKEKLLTVLGTRVLKTKKTPPLDEEKFALLLGKLGRQKKTLKKALEALGKPVCGELSREVVTARFIKNHFKQKKHLLKNYLPAEGFDFDEKQYDRLLEVVQKGKGLYEKVQTIKHPLRILHTDIFGQEVSQTAFRHVYATSNRMLAEANTLNARLSMALEQYGEDLEEHYQEHYQYLKHISADLRDNISDHTGQYGKDFNSLGMMSGAKLRVFGIFSKKYRFIREQKLSFEELYTKLDQELKDKPYFDYTFSNIRGGKNFEKIYANLLDFETTLEAWREKIPGIAKEETMRMQSKNVRLAAWQEPVKKLEDECVAYVEELNSLQLMSKSFSDKAHTLSLWKEQIDKINDTLEDLSFNLRDFDAFFYWHQFWLSCSEEEHALLSGLVKARPDDWEAAFNSWYYHQCLHQNEEDGMLQHNKLLLDYAESHKQMRAEMPLKIRRIWIERQQNCLKELWKEDKQLYNMLFSKKNHELSAEKNLQEMLRSYTSTLTEICPIWLTTPDALGELFPMPQQSFDLVIFDEAGSLSTEEGLSGLWLGKRHVFFGHEYELEPAFKPSLLDFAKENKAKEIELEFCYPDVLPELHQFWNSFLPLKKLKNLPFPTPDYDQIPFQIKFENLNGIYEESTRVNETEAQGIVKILSELKPGPSGLLPSVGILCWTAEQRNLIISHLQRLKESGNLGSSNIEELENLGLSVWHANEARGKRAEVLLISTTLGPIDTTGKLTKELEQLELRKIQTLCCSPARQLIVCTSLEIDYLKTQLKSKDQKGLSMLAAYLVYMDACSRGDLMGQRQVLGEPETEIVTEETLIPAIAGLKAVGTIEKSNYTALPDTARLLKNPYGKDQLLLRDALMGDIGQGAFLWYDILSRYWKQTENVHIHDIWSLSWWRHPENEYDALKMKDDKKEGASGE